VVRTRDPRHSRSLYFVLELTLLAISMDLTNMPTCKILAQEPITSTSAPDSDCWCILEPAIVGELTLLAQPVVVEWPKDRRSDMVAEETSERMVLSLGIFPLRHLSSLLPFARLGQSGGRPFRAMHFSCYNLPVPLPTSLPEFVTLSCRIATIS